MFEIEYKIPFNQNGRITTQTSEDSENSLFNDVNFGWSSETDYLRQISESDSRVMEADNFQLKQNLRRTEHTSVPGSLYKFSIYNNIKNWGDNNFFSMQLKNLENSSSKVLASKLMNIVTSWQVRVQIIEIKYLFGTNEQVYCKVEIGGETSRKIGRTTTKNIGDLNFNEVSFVNI